MKIKTDSRTAGAPPGSLHPVVRRPRYPFPGVLADGSYAPRNSDKARLDYLARRPGILKNLKAGVRVTNVDTHWQASVRAALDAAMETERRELRAKGLDPKW